MDDWLDDEGFLGNQAAFQGTLDHDQDLPEQQPEEIDDGNFRELVFPYPGNVFIITQVAPVPTP